MHEQAARQIPLQAKFPYMRPCKEARQHNLSCSTAIAWPFPPFSLEQLQFVMCNIMYILYINSLCKHRGYKALAASRLPILQKASTRGDAA
jgi:hypothetical protein